MRALLEFYSNEKPPIVAPILLLKEFEGLEKETVYQAGADGF